MIFNKYPQILFFSSDASFGNMSYIRGEKVKVSKNRQKLFQKLNIPANSIVEVKQVHGNKIINVNKPLTKKITADGMVTNQKGLFLLLKLADCMPIAIYDPNKKVTALIHVGFRGLDKKILENAVKLFKKHFQSSASDLLVQIGPSIGPCCYRMDIWTEAENQLTKLGLLKKNIDNPRLCTYHNKQYYSHRETVTKNLPNDYRFVTILGIINE